MLTKTQAHRLRGLIARHAQCQHELGRLTPKSAESTRRRVRGAADEATRAVYGEVLALTKTGAQE